MERNFSVGNSVVSDCLLTSFLGEVGVSCLRFPLCNNSLGWALHSIVKASLSTFQHPVHLALLLASELASRWQIGMWVLECPGPAGQCQLLPLLASRSVCKRASRSSESHCKNTACSSLGEWRGVSHGCWRRSWWFSHPPHPVPELSGGQARRVWMLKRHGGVASVRMAVRLTRAGHRVGRGGRSCG